MRLQAYKPWIVLAIVILAITSLYLYRPEQKSKNNTQVDTNRINGSDRPVLVDVSVINLDSSKKRWLDVKKQLEVLPYPVERFPAIDGRKMSEASYAKQGIPYVLWPSTADQRHKKARPGEIGCYLSHRELLKQLGSKSALPNAGHLILEDDITIEKDAEERITRALQTVPSDWDILCLSVSEQLDVGYPMNGIAKVTKFHGTYAMIIRHGSIPKISDAIRIMFSPIDVMLYMCEKLTIYLVVPEIVHFRRDVGSDIRD